MKRLKNQAGQMVIEYILVMTVMMSVTYAIAEYFRSNEVLAQLIATPFTQLAGMIQNGQWGSPADTMTQHPNQWGMRAAQAGEDPSRDCGGGGGT